MSRFSWHTCLIGFGKVAMCLMYSRIKHCYQIVLRREDHQSLWLWGVICIISLLITTASEHALMTELSKIIKDNFDGINRSIIPDNSQNTEYGKHSLTESDCSSVNEWSTCDTWNCGRTSTQESIGCRAEIGRFSVIVFSLPCREPPIPLPQNYVHSLNRWKLI